MDIKVGQEVRVLKSLNCKNKYRLKCLPNMEANAGKIGKVVGVSSNGTVMIDCNDASYWYSPDMYQPLKFSIGDRVMVDKYGSEDIEYDVGWVYLMDSYRGKVTTIVDRDNNGFTLKKGGIWYWSSDMLLNVYEENEEEEEEMDYKVGDRVKIREDLREGTKHGIYCNCMMEKNAGKVAIITDYVECSEHNYYKINLDQFSYTAEMFEGKVSEISIEDIEVGDKVKIISEVVPRKRYEAGFMHDMKQYCGKIGNVIRVGNKYISIDLDNGTWSWSMDMIEEVMPKKELSIDDLKIGDKIRIISKVDEEYEYEYEAGWSEEMDAYLGKVATVKSKVENAVLIDIDEQEYYWSADMIAEVLPRGAEYVEECLESKKPMATPYYDFSDALAFAKDREKIARKAWMGMSYVAVKDDSWDIEEPYLVVEDTENHHRMVYIPSMQDFFAEDWYTVEEEEEE